MGTSPVIQLAVADAIWCEMAVLKIELETYDLKAN